MKRDEVDINKLAKAYLLAKKYVINNGYSGEIDWQESICFKSVDYQYFLKEYAWVVIASGLSDKVVSKVFPKIQAICGNWDDLNLIEKNYDRIKKNALLVFNNELKINAILKTSVFVNKKGFGQIKQNILTKGISYLRSFSFIGEATSYHLAKNIGLSFAKPDRHLLRISRSIGFESPFDLCQTLSEFISEKIEVVDLVIWRYATLDKNYSNKLNQLFTN
ncbi:MAG TPA: hypothetical protein VIH57_12815 [Bacteroidales bacterium]